MAPLRTESWQPKSGSVRQLLDNELNTFKQASDMLINISHNIMNNPIDAQYRKLLLADETVEKTLISAHGAIPCLFEMGFIEDGNCLRLPIETSLVAVKHLHDEISMAQKYMASKSPNTPTTEAPRATGPPLGGRMSTMEAVFLSKLRSSYEHVLIYEDALLQKKTLEHIPVEELKKKAKRLMSDNSNQNCTKDENTEKDFLIVTVLDWFKNSFFSWVDAPVCSSCSKASCRPVGSVDPLPSELRWGGHRVENYMCASCNCMTRFPRYNHPGKLLETRSGRCGEWANCFTLVCVSLGFEARYVLDWTDHVWTEVYSEAQQRWLHCDPCENVCDTPLLYERGWGKKLTYVLAFSRDDIQDVTWRYSLCHRDTLTRRSECREAWLVDAIVRLRNERARHLSRDRRDVLARRVVQELIEMMCENKTRENLPGRATGSLAWRQARGELGASETTPYVFKLTEAETRTRTFRVYYSSARDLYVRVSEDGCEITGWRSCVFDCDHMIRKVEHDWKMTYLARTENSPTASITWNFDFTGTKLAIHTVEILVRSACYETGRIQWLLCNDITCVPLKGQAQETVTDFYGATSLKLTAKLSEGRGDNAWQHTQLFRQALDSKDVGLDIEITFKAIK